jgi:hypothetical protein
MSIRKHISTLPDMKRTYASNLNEFAMIRGIFITNKDFSIPVDDFTDLETWRQGLEDGNIVPVYYIQEFEDRSEETIYGESLQDNTYYNRAGKYRHLFKFDFSDERHQTLEALSGTDLYVYYWDINWHIYGCREGDNVRGFKTNRIILEKQVWASGNNPMLSPLDIEWKDSNDWNQNGYVEKVTWNPNNIDRLFLSIEIVSISSVWLNFTAKYNGQFINDIEASGITLTDDINGELTFSFFNYAAGIYQLSDFSDNLTYGVLQVVSNIYLGCASYRVESYVPVTTYLVYEDDNRIAFEGIYDGDILITEN